MALLVRFPARRFQWFLIAAPWLPLVQTVFPRRSALTSAQLPDPPRATKFLDEDSAGIAASCSALSVNTISLVLPRPQLARRAQETGRIEAKIHFPSKG